MGRLNVRLCGIELDNPIIPASGTFGYGMEFSQLYDLNLLGALSVKGTTRFPREGNPLSRIAEAPCGMLNAVGLQNPGAEHAKRVELPELSKYFHKPCLMNVSGFSVEEYAETCALLDEVEQIGWFEVNISCPNVHGGGLSFGTDPAQAAAVTAAVRKVTRKPILVKLSPNVTDIVPIAKACEDAGADGLVLINTLTAMRIDLRTRQPILGNLTGGLSGPALLPIALRMLWQVYEAVRIPLVGCGGVSTAEDVLEMMLAGATAVEVGSANLVNPFACPEILAALPAAMDRYGVDQLCDITGGAHHA